VSTIIYYLKTFSKSFKTYILKLKGLNTTEINSFIEIIEAIIK